MKVLNDVVKLFSEGVNTANAGDTVTFGLSSMKVVVVDGDTVVTGVGSILVVAEGDTVVVGMVDRLHPVATSQLVVDVVTSTIRMVGFGRGTLVSAVPAGATAVPADTSDAVGQ